MPLCNRTQLLYISRAISAGIVLSPRDVLATRVARRGKQLPITSPVSQLVDSTPFQTHFA